MLGTLEFNSHSNSNLEDETPRLHDYWMPQANIWATRLNSWLEVIPTVLLRWRGLFCSGLFLKRSFDLSSGRVIGACIASLSPNETGDHQPKDATAKRRCGLSPDAYRIRVYWSLAIILHGKYRLVSREGFHPWISNLEFADLGSIWSV